MLGRLFAGNWKDVPQQPTAQQTAQATALNQASRGLNFIETQRDGGGWWDGTNANATLGTTRDCLFKAVVCHVLFQQRLSAGSPLR